MTPDQYCEQRAAASGSSFYYSFRFLSTERRQAITALYAYCREVDDAVDECAEAQVAQAKLAWWRSEVVALDAGQPSHPVTRALHDARQRFQLPAEQLTEIIDGMAMDLEHARYADFKALHLYCYRAASVVGLLAAEIFGYTDRRTLKYAHDLGLALQLTNIIRDVGEDARRGRIYLPQDEMARFGVTEDNILRGVAGNGFRELMAFQTERAISYYAKAMEELPMADRKSQAAGLIMAAIYRTVLDEIVRAEYPVLHSRISLPPSRKLWLALKTWMRA